MEIAKKLKGDLDRVLAGRVTKPSKSPTSLGPSSQTKSSTARSGFVNPKEIRQILIKQEDDGGATFASATYRAATPATVGSPLGTQQSTECSREMDQRDGSAIEMVDDGIQNDSEDGLWETTESISAIISSDEPIPSIEPDEERGSSRSVAYLYGAAKSKKNMKSLRIGYLGEESDDKGDQNENDHVLDNDELQETLIEEMEEDLLIAEDDLLDYVKHRFIVDEIETWPKEAARLYKLLYLRGLYPLMSPSWAWDFFGHPMPNSIFAPKDSDDKVLIKAYDNQFQAARAIRDLFRLYSRVLCLRQTGHTVRIGQVITKELNVYLRWATRDAGLRRIGHDIGFIWPVFVIDFSRAHDATKIVSACQNCAQKYRSKWADLGIVEYPRLITIFAVIQHVVVVLVVDTEEAESHEPIPITEVDWSESNHWLDCAIAISIPIMLARESLLKYRDSFPVTEREDSDPDL